MFDIGWSEMAVIMLVALIVIGPKDLPRLARNIGQWVAKGRAMAREFQRSLEDMAREAELDDVKREIEKVGRIDIKKSIERTIDPSGDLGKAFDPSSSKPRLSPGANGQAKEPAQVASDVATPTAPTPVRTTKAEAVAAAEPSGPPPAAAAPEAPVKASAVPPEAPAKPKATRSKAAPSKAAQPKAAAEASATTKPGAASRPRTSARSKPAGEASARGPARNGDAAKSP